MLPDLGIEIGTYVIINDGLGLHDELGTFAGSWDEWYLVSPDSDHGRWCSARDDGLLLLRASEFIVEGN